MPPSYPSRISSTFFFGKDGTIKGLESLAAASSLVLYCGAGVSIDQTSVTWTELVAGLFRIARAARGRSRKKESKSVEYLLRYLADDRQAASVMVEEFRAAGESDNIFLGTKLKDVLYGNIGWRRGYIMRNLVQLSLAATRLGRDVSIITTNYDVYIEDEFVARRKKLIDAGLPEEELGGLNRRVFAEGGTVHIEMVVPAGANAKTVELVYLHGRVDHSGGVEGDIVLTEESYAITGQRSSEILRESFSGAGTGVLIIGASLTDEPLIQALALTKAQLSARFALLTAPQYFNDPLQGLDSDDPETTIDGASVRAAWQLRASHLGVTQLPPMSHSQSAQFMEELRVCLTAAELTNEAKCYGAPGSQIGYPQRLSIWHDSWSQRKNLEDPTFAFRVLGETLSDIKLLVKEKAESGETFRVEVWARRTPSSTHRSLTLWANSTGPLFDESTMRTERVSAASQNASVKAMIAGRPQLIKITDMDYEETASRWQTFLSIPIFVRVPTMINTVADSAYVPVGVVTLASDRQLNVEKNASVLSDSLAAEDFAQIKGFLIAMGRDVLRMSEGVRPWSFCIHWKRPEARWRDRGSWHRFHACLRHQLAPVRAVIEHDQR